jgi:hypothetical protein
MFHKLFAISFFIFSTNSQIEEKWISSPRTTTWGEWGPEVRCPPGHFVNSFRLYYEGWRIFFRDDTAVNGIMLHCTDLGNPHDKDRIALPWLEWKDEDKRKYITSRVGPYGKWLEWTTCYCGVAIGFMLKSEVYQVKYTHEDYGLIIVINSNLCLIRGIFLMTPQVKFIFCII